MENVVLQIDSVGLTATVPGELSSSAASTIITWEGWKALILPVKFSGAVPPSKAFTLHEDRRL